MFKNIYNKYKNLISQFALERAIWIKAGKPIRDKDRMKEIYQICKGCEHFNANACQVCGCRLHPVDTTFPNKIAWATTECPLDTPKWLAETMPEITEEDIGVYIEETTAQKSKSKQRSEGCGCGKKNQ